MRRELSSRAPAHVPSFASAPWRLCALALVLAFLAPLLLGAPAPQRAATEFRQALPGYRFAFPQDHYAHEDFRTEWWYYTGHLATPSGDRFGYQVTFFRSGLPEARGNPSRWAARNLYLAHFAVSDIGARRFSYFERVSREALGQAGASRDAFRVWNGDWEVQGDGEAQRLRAREGGFAVELMLVPLKPPVVHGRDGVSRKGEGPGQASHYYSLTRLKTEGRLTVRGKTVEVKDGSSWMDHEFGSTELAPNQVGWDWFSLQLDDGAELMLYLIRRAGGEADPASAGTWVGPDGASRHLERGEFSVEVLERWRSPRSKGVYPMGWRIRVPGLGLDVRVTPAFPEQELDTARSTQVVYWEGAGRAEGTRAGRPVTGKAYVEMTGYAAPFRKRL
ncbi:MAG: lipocalin-like domain-containing protein [Candidatus Methylomirabilales bacterium]